MNLLLDCLFAGGFLLIGFVMGIGWSRDKLDEAIKELHEAIRLHKEIKNDLLRFQKQARR